MGSARPSLHSTDRNGPAPSGRWRSKLTYYGVSYGSMLGQTYANMFPNNFRALVIDGVLDPIAWTTGATGEQDLPFSTRLRSDVGAQETLEEFFRLCNAGGDACPLADSAYKRRRSQPVDATQA